MVVMRIRGRIAEWRGLGVEVLGGVRFWVEVEDERAIVLMGGGKG